MWLRGQASFYIESKRDILGEGEGIEGEGEGRGDGKGVEEGRVKR